MAPSEYLFRNFSIFVKDTSTSQLFSRWWNFLTEREKDTRSKSARTLGKVVTERIFVFYINTYDIFSGVLMKSREIGVAVTSTRRREARGKEDLM